ncbi:Site-specific DNA recombinase [Thermomonospora echinospora]|uniref:Site-specific DNA recombinase n=1 Tax=Thermomonospora echinospora TaxID=1992 RepID=A0A1H5XS75_9ACTN|nr:recombinase family protein [Thermomonospora echinospora]SEG14594.1 Site-specific DNA recombinase [Thermomonospora echinospora]
MTATDRDLIPVVDYARASVDKAKDEHTVEDQQAANEKTAGRLGCRIVARFADNDKSAAKADVYRDDFEEMLKVLRKGKLSDGTPVMGCIVTADDRLVRRAGDYERFVDAITHEEGRVYADKRGFKDLYSEDVESMGLMGAVISRMEVKRTRRRVRNWHRARAERGLPPKAHRAFGWMADGTTIDQGEAALIRKAIDELISGRSQASIVREWQAKGVKTPRGYDWTTGTLRKMLLNPRLCGWRMIQGEIVEVDGKPVTGQWEPIISPERWQAVRAFYDARRGKIITRDGAVRPMAPDHREHSYLLTGVLRCGRILPDGSMCGKKLRVVNDRKTGVFRYYCQDKTQGGCGGLSRRGDKLEEFISEAVLAKLEERAKSARRDIGPWPRERELIELQEQLAELRAQWGKRKVSNALFFAEVERLEPEIAKLRAERERYELASQQSETDISDIRRRWYSETDDDRLDLGQKRAYVRGCFLAIIVHPAGKGNGSRTTFNPDLLELIWRED